MNILDKLIDEKEEKLFINKINVILTCGLKQRERKINLN